MATAHLERMATDRHREANRAVNAELLALALRREAHRRAQENNR